MRILITAPLKQEPEIFREYQDSLDRLIIPEGFRADRFFVVNDCPEIIPHIRNAAFITHNTGDEYRKAENDHLWTDANFRKMSDLRNMTIRYMLGKGYDYWFSVDTDLVLNPHTLEYLIAADKDIISEIFWTQSASGLWCNAWMHDQYGVTREHFEQWRKPGVYPVGMTGALTLVKRKVFEAGVGYARIPNLQDAIHGEDRHFCVRAACAGFGLWIDTNAPATHLYSEEIYREYMKQKEKQTDHEGESLL